MNDDMPRTATVSDEEILGAFDQTPSPVTTAPDLAGVLPLGESAIRKRLKRLRAAGRVESYDVGSRATIWYVCTEV